MTNDTDTCPATNRDGEPCGLSAGWGTDNDSGPCKFHGGASTGAPEGNDNAAKAGAWADDFFEGFLTEEEQRRVREATDVLGSDAGAQEIGRHVAMLSLEQFRRTGDERFLRRFESICDKFSIAPAEEITVDGDVSHTLEEGFAFDFADDDGGGDA